MRTKNAAIDEKGYRLEHPHLVVVFSTDTAPAWNSGREWHTHTLLFPRDGREKRSKRYAFPSGPLTTLGVMLTKASDA